MIKLLPKTKGFFFRKQTYALSLFILAVALFFSTTTFSQTPDFSVQHLQDDVARSGGANTSFTAVASLNSAVALANNNRKVSAGRPGSGGNAEGDDLAGARQLTATGTLTYYREGSSTNNDTRFNTSIWEYIGAPGGNNEMIVRGRYAVSLNGGTNSVTQVLSGISNANDCIPFITGIMNNSTSDDADSGTAIAYLENATTLRVQKGSNGNNVTVYITVVEFTGSNWTVLHGDSGNVSADAGTLTLRDGSDGTGTATNVSAWSEAIIFSHHRGDTGASGTNDAISDNWPLIDVGADNQSVDWTFHSNHDSAGTNRHFVHVLNNAGLNVTRYQNTNSAAGESTINIASAGLTNTAEALIIGSSRSSGGGTAYGRGWRNYYFNSTTGAAHWSHRSGNSINHEIQIVDLVGLNTPVSGPEINIQGNATNIIDGDNTPSASDDTDFGNVDVVAGTQINTFTIQNLGTTNLTLSGASPYVTVSGANAGDFTVTVPFATTPIAPSGSTTFEITFNPSAVGIRTATLTINNNDSDETIYNFDIQGTGTTSIIGFTNTIYYENFDANNGSWIATNPGGNTVWTHGLNTDLDGTEGNHWYTDNYNDYANNSHTYATSPIIDLTGFNSLVFKIDILYDTEVDLDGMNIEYSSNGGASWTILGAYSASPVNYWYNDTDVDGIGNNIDGWSNINPVVSAVAGHSDFVEASISLPSSLNNNANARFRVQFASNGSNTDNGVNFDNVIIQGNYITSPSDPTYAPGAVTSNLKVWLKANSGTSTTTDGNALSTWSDEAYDNDAIGITSNRPTYNNSAAENINFNPVINFVNASGQEMRGKGGYYAQDYFMVLEPNTPYDASTLFGQQAVAGKFSADQFAVDGTGLGLGLISSRYTNAVVAHTISSYPLSGPPNSTSYGRAYEHATNTVGGVMLVNVKTNAADTSTEIYVNGERIDSATGQSGNGSDLFFREFENLQYYLGTGRFTSNGHAVDGHFDGKMAEFLSYSVKNSTADKEKVQSSLAIKYGITLHTGTQTTETDVDYVDSAGSVIWDEAVNSGFNYDIAGIGRDDDAELNQKQSKSVNSLSAPTTADDITIGLTDIAVTNSANGNTFSTDKSYLVWGNDNASLNAVVPDVMVDMSAGIVGLTSNVTFTSVERTWKVVESGTVGVTKISIPEAMLSGTISPPGAYLMFISNTPTFSPTSEYRIMTLNGSDLETLYNFNGTKYITFGYAPERTFTRSIYFDGVTDYLDAGDVLDLTSSSFSMSAWVKRDVGFGLVFGATGEIISKRDIPYTEGYSMLIEGGHRARMIWKNGGASQIITSSVVIPVNVWHHIAVTYDGTNARMYIDGVLDVTTPLSPPDLDTTQRFLIGAANYTARTRFFQGNIDEVRVWDVTLTQDQLRYIMNQEIEDNGNVAGSYFTSIGVTPTKEDIAAIPWSNLQAYYPMSTYTYTNAKDESDNGYTAALVDLTTVDFQTAPLPYQSSGTTTDWDTDTTWINGDVQTIPGATSIVDNTTTVDGNIVSTSHNITMNNSSLPVGNNDNRTLLGLIVNSNELTIDGTTGNGLTVTHYLELDGVIDLEGESQLIQTDRSDLATSSSGYIEKDQQGTANAFTYNYWSSPVSLIGAGTNNTAFTIGDILRDGTSTASPVALDFEAGTTLGTVSAYYADGAVSSPRKVAKRWLWTYNNSGNDYANWDWLGSTHNLNVTDGYTMKGISGTSAIGTDQNYVFIGKPNNVLNGDTEIVHTTFAMPADPLYPDISLTGNPFPSALDANQFITDNMASTNGQLYFWEHWGGGDHLWKNYQGGYAVRTIVTGTPAVSHPDVDQTGSGSKIPGQYIAVGQGFYVISSAGVVGPPGDVVFNNRQRAFQKEGASSTFFKQRGKSNKSSNTEEGDGKMIIRVGFESPKGFHRQVAVAFEIEGATDGFDKGYDGRSGDFLSNDAFFIQDDKYYVIQAFGDFKKEREIPISIFIDADNDNGVQKFMIDKLENIPDNVEVYIKDNVSGETYDIKNQNYEVNLPTGEHKTRFSLVFQPRLLRSDEIAEIEEGFIIYVNNNLSEINIKKIADIVITKAVLVNSLGQTISIWSSGLENRDTVLPVNVSTGVYILSVETELGTIIKKLLIE